MKNFINSFKDVLSCQFYMIKRMWLVSKVLFLCTLLEAVINGVLPVISLLFTRNLIEQLTAANWHPAIFYVVAIALVRYLGWLLPGYLALPVVTLKPLSSRLCGLIFLKKPAP